MQWLWRLECAILTSSSVNESASSSCHCSYSRYKYSPVLTSLFPIFHWRQPYSLLHLPLPPQTHRSVRHPQVNLRGRVVENPFQMRMLPKLYLISGHWLLFSLYFSPYKTPLSWSLFPRGVPKISHEVVIAGVLLPSPTKKEKETISSFGKKTKIHWSSSLSFSATQLVALTTIWLTSHVIHCRSWDFSILDEDTPSCDLSILLACQF